MNLSEVLGGSLERLTSEMRTLVARLNTVLGREHQADGTHAIPKYRTSVYGTDMGAINFRGSGSMTLTGVTVNVLDWWKHGDGYHVNFSLTGTVGGTPSTALKFDIPGGYRAFRSALNPIFLLDNATRGTGYAFVEANGTTVDCYRTDGANWTAGTVIAIGQLSFRTTN